MAPAILFIDVLDIVAPARGTDTDKDVLVLADFANATGDSVFDGTLRQGLSVQLEQSPFLSIISDEKIQQTLGLMGQPVDAKLIPAIAREVCQRTASAAVLDGSIAKIGTHYLLTLRAVNCESGKTLASASPTRSAFVRTLLLIASMRRRPPTRRLLNANYIPPSSTSSCMSLHSRRTIRRRWPNTLQRWRPCRGGGTRC